MLIEPGLNCILSSSLSSSCSEISSLHADLSTLPPLFVSVGQLEIFIPEIVEVRHLSQ